MKELAAPPAPSGSELAQRLSRRSARPPAPITGASKGKQRRRWLCAPSSRAISAALILRRNLRSVLCAPLRSGA